MISISQAKTVELQAEALIEKLRLLNKIEILSSQTSQNLHPNLVLLKSHKVLQVKVQAAQEIRIQEKALRIHTDTIEEVEEEADVVEEVEAQVDVVVLHKLPLEMEHKTFQTCPLFILEELLWMRVPHSASMVKSNDLFDKQNI